MCRVAVIVVACAQLTALAQQRALVETADTNGALLRGILWPADDGSEPLRGARLTVTHEGEFIATGATGADGRFAIAVPSAGPFALSVTKAGFAPTALALTLDLAAQPLEIRLPRGAVLTGRVREASGEPAVSVGVRARRSADPASIAAAAGPQEFLTETDDLGEFRIGSLPAGRYELSLEEALCQPWTRAAGFGPAACGLTSLTRAASSSARVLVDLRAGDERQVELIDHAADGGGPAGPGVAVTGPADGTGSIAGRIVSGGGLPIAGARVTIAPVTAGAARTVTVMSDTTGRYLVSSLPPGRYRVLARKPAFHDGEHGRQRARATTGVPVDVPDAAQLHDIDVTLARGPVITGRIVDAHGDPLEGILVEAWERRFVDGRFTASPARTARLQRTDDRGQYRIHGLLPGAYYVVASDQPAPAAGDVGPIVSRGADRTDAVIDSLRNETQRMIDGRNHTRMFYPGRSSGADAVAVEIEAERDAFGIDMVFEALAGVRIHGVLVDAAGRSLDETTEATFTNMRLVPRVPPGAPVLVSQPALRGPEGTFAFENVVPGEYLIEGQLLGLAVPPPVREFGAYPVTVGTADIGPLVVRTSPGSAVEGRIVFEGGSPPAAPSGVHVWTISDGPDGSRPGGQVRIRPDWTFEVAALSGLVRLGLRHAPPGWWLKSALIDGVNATENPIAFGRAVDSRTDVEVVLAATAPRLTGRALGDRNQGVPGAAILAFPADPARWWAWPYHQKLTRSDAEGRFALETLPPGEYWVVATIGMEDRIDSGEWQSPDWLGRLVPSARRVRLQENEQRMLDLQVVSIR